MSDKQPSQTTIEQVKAMLRQDLKLGKDFDLQNDTPLLDGQLDLDSLDVLMLITSMEKKFGFKIPDAKIGREIFRDAQTLALYIDEQVNSSQSESASDKPAGEQTAQTLDQRLNSLPHAAPFRFLTSLVALDPGIRGEGRWELNGDEPFFEGHFPGRPIVPGVLISEALAQLSGIVGATTQASAEGVLAHIDVRFKEKVQPPAELALHSLLVQSLDGLQHYEVRAMIDDRVVAEGTLTLSIPHPLG